MIGSRGLETLQSKTFGADADKAWQLEQVELLQVLVLYHSLE